MNDPLAAHKEDLARIQRSVDDLGEHFETVQIFCSRHSPAEHDGTETFQRGSGNWFARYGQIRTWLTKAETRSDEESRSEYRQDNA